jgi:hypothetical protein
MIAEMNAESIDNLSAELLNALDTLNDSINRKTLQILFNGEQQVEVLYNLLSNSRTHFTMQGYAVKLKALEKANLIHLTLSDDQRTIQKIKLTIFGEVLLQSLLMAQKLLVMIH